MKIAKTLYRMTMTSRFVIRQAHTEILHERAIDWSAPPGDNRVHLQATIDWIKRAHNVSADSGVPRAYCAGWNFHFRSHGWQPSYPETTGYIIPTLYDAADALNDPDLRIRAAKMADWEYEIQLASGAVMGGTVDRKPTPAVFNTGQVMLGWLRAHTETGEARFLEAAARAGDYLVRAKNPEGFWQEGNSAFADARFTVYNTRVGHALILLGQATGEKRYIAAGRRNMDHALTMQADNGFFRDNCLSDPDQPLLHTICYAAEGLQGAGMALQEPQYLDAAKRTCAALLGKIDEQGRIPGRLDANWRGTVEWDCLTGSAQLAGLLLRFAQITADQRYIDGARRLLHFIKKTQNLDPDAPSGIRGGVKGSYPFDGGYGQYELLNWAAKFFIDALLLDEKIG
ncbi:hypothetical protein MAIT1_00266 [Magnetofaba australis IT-1]|uniref:Uncharacterized protein n=1 Tax=Magnetofaba australis IT-1 TaxID=1434232 RepID=A0A1Y2K801_9PROT|nr:hypothetical protein MAIT1_00266 [Magnetofaba australis IT-1]